MINEMYWDGEENPSVRVPFGDFFGIDMLLASIMFPYH
jgi:hypothetical protein